MAFLSEISSVRAHCLVMSITSKKFIELEKKYSCGCFLFKALTFQFNSIHFENKKGNPYLKLNLKLKIEIETIFRSFVTIFFFKSNRI